MRWVWVMCAAAVLISGDVGLAGCRKNIDTEDAVKQGILDYLSKRPDLSAMDVNVTAVSFKQDEADATVYFSPKGGPPGNGIQLSYILEREGNKWVVKGRAAGAPHGGIPQGGISNPQSGAQLPPDHPATPAQPPSAGR